MINLSARSLESPPPAATLPPGRQTSNRPAHPRPSDPAKRGGDGGGGGDEGEEGRWRRTSDVNVNRRKKSEREREREREKADSTIKVFNSLLEWAGPVFMLIRTPAPCNKSL